MHENETNAGASTATETDAEYGDCIATPGVNWPFRLPNVTNGKKWIQGTAKKSPWIQETAFDALMEALAPLKKFPSAFGVYAVLCRIAAETDSEPGPEHDGRPFEATLAQITGAIRQPKEVSISRLDDLVRLKIIDPFEMPAHKFATVVFRLRYVELEAKEGAI